MSDEKQAHEGELNMCEIEQIVRGQRLIAAEFERSKNARQKAASRQLKSYADRLISALNLAEHVDQKGVWYLRPKPVPVVEQAPDPELIAHDETLVDADELVPVPEEVVL